MVTGNGDAALFGPPNLLVAREAPFAHGGDDPQVGVERLDRDVEADLVVALARAAVRHRRRTEFLGGFDQQPGLERPCQGGGEEVVAFVDGAALEGGPDEILDEQVLGVRNDGIHRANVLGALLDACEIALMADINRHGDHVHVVLFLNPADRYGRVQSTGIRED